MKMSKKVTRPRPDEVDRALAAVQRAVDTLIRLMVHEDHGFAAKAALAIGDLGTLPARPLAAAISRTSSPYHRMAMVILLREVSPPFDVEVFLALAQVLASDPSEQVKAFAKETVAILSDRSPKLYKRPAAREAGQQQDLPGPGELAEG